MTAGEEQRRRRVHSVARDAATLARSIDRYHAQRGLDAKSRYVTERENQLLREHLHRAEPGSPATREGREQIPAPDKVAESWSAIMVAQDRRACMSLLQSVYGLTFSSPANDRLREAREHLSAALSSIEAAYASLHFTAVDYADFNDTFDDDPDLLEDLKGQS